MSFSREMLAEKADDFNDLFLDQVDRLVDWSRSSRNLLRRRPEYLNWLLDNGYTAFSQSNFLECWKQEYEGKLPSIPDAKATTDALRLFRSRMSLRIAFREVNELTTTEESLLETSLLADFCLGTIFSTVYAELKKRLGVPWDESRDESGRCCVLGMGKLGGLELNFCSDVDLIFIYDGESNCRKDGISTSLSAREFHARLVRTMVALLQENTADGILYNVDLRLRPEGETGPLVKNLQSTVNYYYTVGQTWERLALARARPVAGDSALGGEFLEEVHSFAHPRHPPPSLLRELAMTRARFGRDKQDPEDYRNIKTGHGGIREIEFFVQGLQLLHAGEQPFLQVRSTLDAIDKLAKYEIIQPYQTGSLREAYLFLRKVENRLQMEEELPTHELPNDNETQQALRVSLGYNDWDAFLKTLQPHRQKTREAYVGLFGKDSEDNEFEDWFTFFGGDQAIGIPAQKIPEWFGVSPGIEAQLRIFVLGGHSHFLTLEHVRLFLSLSEHFPKTLPLLAFPMQTLQRLGKFGEHYGTRKGLYKACAMTPRLFEMLCLLFDSSPFIHNHLCKHPEILDELLTLPVHRLNSAEETLKELGNLPEDKNFQRWLWLYVRAEQIRSSMGEHLGYFDTPVIEKNLSQLADCVLIHLLRKFDLENRVALVALGKYGAEELTIGSDLDLLFLSSDKPDSELNHSIRKFIKIASWQGSLSQTFEVDIRLRPYGEDGPLISTLNGLESYHVNHAKPWERQCLTRARFIGGNNELGEEFNQLRERLLFENEFGATQVGEILQMREKIIREKTVDSEKFHAFKACRGGLGEIEFFVQILQMYHGQSIIELRCFTNTRELFRLLPKYKCIDKESCARLLLNYNFLRKLEFFLRRFYGKPVTALTPQTVENTFVTQRFQAENHDAFIAEHQQRMKQSWQEIRQCLEKTFGLAIITN
jgi:glutamate-ammonia-ligase adenylyltransferase